VKAFVEGVTAAAVGAITGAAFVLGRRALTGITTVLLNFKFFARRDDFKQLGCGAGRSLIREKPYGHPMNADKRR
jgi:hypothetical protein